MSKPTMPKGFRIVIEDEPDSYHMLSWTLYAVAQQWKTTEQKRLFRKPLTVTGWHSLEKVRVGSNFVNKKDLARFTSEWIKTASLMEETK